MKPSLCVLIKPSIVDEIFILNELVKTGPGSELCPKS